MAFNFGRSCTQQMCLLSWREGWDEGQKKKFNQVLSEELVCGGDTDDVLFGLENMDLSGNSHEMFNCQLRMFRSWYKGWSAQERETFLRTLVTHNRDVERFLRERHLL